MTDPDAPPSDQPLHAQWRLILLVGAGGMVGTALRYGIGREWPVAHASFPVSTFLINLIGAFLLGLLLELLLGTGADVGPRRALRLGVGTGVLGGFTTYSTLATEATLLVRAGDGGLAATYGLLTVLVGLLATGAGVALAARMAGESA
jgi:CrcB protein